MKKTLKDKLVYQLKDKKNWTEEEDSYLQARQTFFDVFSLKKDIDIQFEEHCQELAKEFGTDKDEILERMIYLGILH